MFSFSKIKKTLSNAEAVVSSTCRYGYIGAMTGSIISVPIFWGAQSMISNALEGLFNIDHSRCVESYYPANLYGLYSLGDSPFKARQALECCVSYSQENFSRKFLDGENVFTATMFRAEFYFTTQCTFVLPEVVGFVIGAAIGFKKGLENINPKTITRIGNNNHAILSEESCKKSHPHRFEQFFIANQNQQHPDLVEENDFVILDKPISLPRIN